MKTILALSILVLCGCSNLAGKSAAYQEVHDKTFWAEYKGGGPDAMAWANLKAHDAAEKQVGK